MSETGRPAKYETAEDLQAGIDAFFADCDAKKRPYTILGLVDALGFASRQSLVDYNGRDGFSDTIKKARQKVQEDVERRFLSGESHPTACIFWLKNNAGWKDKTETEISGDLSVTTITRKIID